MMEKRNHPRIAVSHPVLYFTDIYPRPKVGSTLDLSLGGAGIETPHDLVMGERLEMSIGIRPQSIKCRGKAVYVLHPQNGNIRAGIRFEELSDHDRLYLRQYISYVIETQA
jgi:hypothetical protein